MLILGTHFAYLDPLQIHLLLCLAKNARVVSARFFSFLTHCRQALQARIGTRFWMADMPLKFLREKWEQFN